MKTSMCIVLLLIVFAPLAVWSVSIDDLPLYSNLIILGALSIMIVLLFKMATQHQFRFEVPPHTLVRVHHGPLKDDCRVFFPGETAKLHPKERISILSEGPGHNVDIPIEVEHGISLKGAGLVVGHVNVSMQVNYKQLIGCSGIKEIWVPVYRGVQADLLLTLNTDMQGPAKDRVAQTINQTYKLSFATRCILTASLKPLGSETDIKDANLKRMLEKELTDKLNSGDYLPNGIRVNLVTLKLSLHAKAIQTI